MVFPADGITRGGGLEAERILAVLLSFKLKRE